MGVDVGHGRYRRVVRGLGLLYQWELLFVMEFIFTEVISFWAIVQAVRPWAKRGSGGSGGVRVEVAGRRAGRAM